MLHFFATTNCAAPCSAGLARLSQQNPGMPLHLLAKGMYEMEVRALLSRPPGAVAPIPQKLCKTTIKKYLNAVGIQSYLAAKVHRWVSVALTHMCFHSQVLFLSKDHRRARLRFVQHNMTRNWCQAWLLAWVHVAPYLPPAGLLLR